MQNCVIYRDGDHVAVFADNSDAPLFEGKIRDVLVVLVNEARERRRLSSEAVELKSEIERLKMAAKAER